MVSVEEVWKTREYSFFVVDKFYSYEIPEPIIHVTGVKHFNETELNHLDIHEMSDEQLTEALTIVLAFARQKYKKDFKVSIYFEVFHEGYDYPSFLGNTLSQILDSIWGFHRLGEPTALSLEVLII